METKTFKPRVKRPTISWEDALEIANKKAVND